MCDATVNKRATAFNAGHGCEKWRVHQVARSYDTVLTARADGVIADVK